MRTAMYIFVNSELGMSAGKMSAQAAHAAVEAYRLSLKEDGTQTNTVRNWYFGGHYTKLVMDGGNGANLQVIQRYLEDRGFKCALIIDEGRTEIEPFQPTALGVEIVNRDESHTAATFGEFNTYREKTEPTKKRWKVPKWLHRWTES